MAKVHKDRIIKKIRARDKKMIDRARHVAEEELQDSKRELLVNFLTHPVTKEISEGPTADNISDTLPGARGFPNANLYTFIGFQRGTEPTDRIFQILFSRIRLGPTKRKGGLRLLRYVIPVFAPSAKDLEQEAKADNPPWMAKSWLRGIETGITGLGFFLSKDSPIRGSRSGFGVQIKNRLRNVNYVSTSYMTQIMKDFRRSFKDFSRRKIR